MLTKKSLFQSYPAKLVMKSLCQLTAFMLVCVAFNAAAEVREFPAQARYAVLSVTRLGDLVIDDKLRLTSPATRIISQDGMIVTTSHLDSGKAPILYTETELGEIRRIWLLSAQEASHFKSLKK